MAGSFSEWLRWPDRQVVVLAEADPTLELAGWTAVGGLYPTTYVIALPRSVRSSVIVGGLTQRCIGLRQNATPLTERASIALVEANAGSWYWDEAAELLYAHSTTGTDPDAFTVFHAVVRFYFATKGIVLDRVDGDAESGLYYQPLLDGTLPRIEREVEDIFFGQKLIATGNIRLLNGTGLFDTLVAPDGLYHWKNKQITFYVGGSYNGLALARSQYVAVTAMLIEDVASDDQFATFELKPKARRLTVEAPVRPYFESEYPNLGDGVRGTKKWIGYGRAIIRPDLTDTTVSYGRWTVADAAHQTLFALHSVWAEAKTTGVRTLLTETTHYTKDLTACTVTVTSASYPWQDYTLVVDVTGKPDGAGSYIKTFGAIVVDLLVNVAGILDAEIDQSAFDQCDIDAPEELAMWIKSPRQLTSLLSTTQDEQPSLERSVMGTVQETQTGLFTAWIWDPGYSAADVVSLQKSDFSVFKPKPKLETIVDTVRVNYRRDLSTLSWAQEQESDPKVAFVNETSYALDVYTFLRNQADAVNLAQRLELISGSVSTEIDFELRNPLLVEHIAGDKVLVTYDRAPAASGDYVERGFEIVRLGKSFAPTVAIVGRLGDLRGIGSKIGHVTADDALDWASTSSSDRVGRGYVSDDDGYIDPSDPSTLNARVAW